MADSPAIADLGSEELPWLRLYTEPHLANTDEDIDRNINATLSRDYRPFDSLVNTKVGICSVVGSGPSLKGNWKELQRVGGDIFACNAALQFLLVRDIVPKYTMFFDADPLMLEFVTPHPQVTYLVASRCPPKVLDLLHGYPVYVFHMGGDANISALLDKYNRMEGMIAGGSAAVTRGMVVAATMGYGEIHLWGGDSSFNGADTHIRKSTTDEKCMAIQCNGRSFLAAPWMAQQAEDFKTLAPQMRQLGVKFVVHGDGLIPHIARGMGIEVDGDSRAKNLWRDTTDKAKLLWANL